MKFILTLLMFAYAPGMCIYGCTCIGTSTVKEEVRNSDLVLVGNVVDKKNITLSGVSTLTKDTINYSYWMHTINVQTVYKGKIKSKTVTVFSSEYDGGGCGFNFNVGEQYIIYADNKKMRYSNGVVLPRQYYTDGCSRTCVLNKEEIEEIRKFRNPR